MGLRMVVCLGNPGPRYARTRHNVGFMVAAELMRRARAGADRVQDDAVIAPASMGGRAVLVVQPQTFMNASGSAVARAARRRGIAPDEILLIYDEADLPLGTVRVRTGGSPAGHKGVASIVEYLGTREIPRIRLGIGKDAGELSDRVLAPFTRAEAAQVETMISDAADAAESAVVSGLAAAMNTFNKRDRSPE